ncbi:MAG TPA: tetratricopeptide repeat protein, partial [Kofleriaceae bacterium]|nr:tetratricopeptide repeat protein [Kofleriaceae bacterium]
MERGVLAAAEELFEGRHYPGVVALCEDALENEPECVPLLLMRARAHIALRRELEAQADLRDIIRLDPSCGSAYRLLGELAARRDENDSAAIFFREALRLDPDDQAADDWLQIVDNSLRPAAVAQKLPAPAAATNRFPRAQTN